MVAANEALAISPLSTEGWYAKGWALLYGGDEAAGIDALLKGLQLWGLGADEIATLRSAQNFAAVAAAGADIFQRQSLMFTPKPTDIAFLRAAAGQRDAAFAALEAAAARDDPVLVFLPWLPHVDPLREDPRWPRLLESARLVR